MAFVPANIEFLVQEWKNAPYEPSLFKAEHVNQWQAHLKEIERVGNDAGALAEQVNQNQAALAAGAPKGTMLVSDGTNFVQVPLEPWQTTDRLLMTDASTAQGVRWVEIAGPDVSIYTSDSIPLALAVTIYGYSLSITGDFKVTNKGVVRKIAGTAASAPASGFVSIGAYTLFLAAGSTGVVVPPAMRPSTPKLIATVSATDWNGGGSPRNLGGGSVYVNPNGTLSWSNASTGGSPASQAYFGLSWRDSYSLV